MHTMHYTTMQCMTSASIKCYDRTWHDITYIHEIPSIALHCTTYLPCIRYIPKCTYLIYIKLRWNQVYTHMNDMYYRCVYIYIYIYIIIYIHTYVQSSWSGQNLYISNIIRMRISAEMPRPPAPQSRRDIAIRLVGIDENLRTSRTIKKRLVGGFTGDHGDIHNIYIYIYKTCIYILYIYTYVLYIYTYIYIYIYTLFLYWDVCKYIYIDIQLYTYLYVNLKNEMVYYGMYKYIYIFTVCIWWGYQQQYKIWAWYQNMVNTAQSLSFWETCCGSVCKRGHASNKVFPGNKKEYPLAKTSKN